MEHDRRKFVGGLIGGLAGLLGLKVAVKEHPPLRVVPIELPDEPGRIYSAICPTAAIFTFAPGLMPRVRPAFFGRLSKAERIFDPARLPA